MVTKLLPPFPPTIAPRFASDVIVPAFDNPAPPAALKPVTPFPPLMVPADWLISDANGRAVRILDARAAATPAEK